MSKQIQRQKGMILLMVLLVFSVVAILATSMIERQSVDIERAQTLFTQQQARLYALGAESASRRGLYMDWEADKSIDHAAEQWAEPRTFPLDPGVISITIQDLQGRFNLNSLLPGGSVAVHEGRFRNLLNLTGLDTNIASEWRKWLDKDSNVDNKYLTMEPSYRPAYAECKHTSELMLIENVDLDAYAKLEPYITCLPASVQMNINTASAFVVASLHSQLTLADGEQVIAARGTNGFTTVEDFLASAPIAAVNKPVQNDNGNDSDNQAAAPLVATDFSVTTEYFEMFARIDLNDRIGTVEAVIQRSIADGSMKTLRRDYSRRAARQP